MTRYLILIVITTCAFAGTAPSPSKPLPYTISGWKEVVICVRDMDAYNVFFAELADWRLLEQGPVSAAQLSAWQLDKSASAEHRLYANPGTESGFIRLVQFNGIEQKLIRPDSQSWDTGGMRTTFSSIQPRAVLHCPGFTSSSKKPTTSKSRPKKSRALA